MEWETWTTTTTTTVSTATNRYVHMSERINSVDAECQPNDPEFEPNTEEELLEFLSE